MRITMRATDQLTYVEGVQVRAWKGRTERGNECTVLVYRIVARAEDQFEFEHELKEMLPPGKASDLRHVL